MFTTKYFTITLLALIVSLLATAPNVTTSPTSVVAQEHRLVGSWRIVDPNSGVTIALLTADGSGTTIATSTFSAPAAFVSTAHGVWKKMGKDYLITNWAFLYDDIGNHILTRKVTSQNKLSQDGQSLTADVKIVVMRPDGTVEDTITTVVNGQRITPESL